MIYDLFPFYNLGKPNDHLVQETDRQKMNSTASDKILKMEEGQTCPEISSQVFIS